MTAPTQQKRTLAVLLAMALVTGLVPAIPSVAFADEQATARAGLADASSAETDDGIETLANVAVSGTKITVPSYVRKPSNATRVGIDVSEHNGKINWATLKAAGVQFAIIRCGYGQDYSSQHDDRWIENVKGAARVGIPYGVYIYSYADSVAKAKGEADHIIRLLNESKCKPAYPIYYDLEESSLASWTNAPLLAEMSFAFCSKVSAAGYTPAVYANTNWFTNYLTDPVFSAWGRWVAQYNSRCTYQGTYQMWQCTSDGYAPGLSGNRGRVDVNFELGNTRGHLTSKTGLQMIDGAMYYLDSKGAKKTGWQTIGGKTYYFDKAGAMVTGTQTIGGKKLMFNQAGALAGAWAREGGAWYLRDQNGQNRTGWQRVGSSWYYLSPTTGRMQTGWVKSGGRWYFFKESGAMATGWQQVGDTWYRLSKNGAMVTGWQRIGGARYYFASSGAMQTGWLQQSGKWYFLSSSGALKTGWQQIGGKWYYLTPGSGAMVTGWKKLSGAWYYLKSSGAMATGWAKIDGAWYCFKGSGAMKTGWQRMDGAWYYLSGSGAMKTGWLKQNGVWYYLLPETGAMVADTTLDIDGVSYRFDANGVWIAEDSHE